MSSNNHLSCEFKAAYSPTCMTLLLLGGLAIDSSSFTPSESGVPTLTAMMKTPV